ASRVVAVRTRPPARSPLFPYTPLFRSRVPARYPLCDLVLHLPPRMPPGSVAESVTDLVAAGSRNRSRRCGPEFTRVVVTDVERLDRKSTRLNSSHVKISYAVFCLKKKR